MNKLITLITLTMFGALQAVWNGYAFSVLWGWFIASKFNAPPISIPEAIGICFIAAYITYQFDAKSIELDWVKNKEETLKVMIFSFVKPAVAIGTGWIVTLFI